jgi:hypothetical protein
MDANQQSGIPAGLEALFSAGLRPEEPLGVPEPIVPLLALPTVPEAPALLPAAPVVVPAEAERSRT